MISPGLRTLLLGIAIGAGCILFWGFVGWTLFKLIY